MRVAVSGASGLIGRALLPALAAAGHNPVRLVRRAATAPDEVQWAPMHGTIDAEALRGLNAAVHLAGEGIGEKRWSEAQKQRILDSRVKGTALLAMTLAALEPRPTVFVSGSAIGYYGLRGDEELNEQSSAGSGFLADVVKRWEAAAAPASEAGIRTVLLRSGIVLSRDGGAFAKMLPLLKLGLGGRLGSGKQWWSWISIDDEVGLILHALTNGSIEGPMNATAPAPATNRDLTRMAGDILGRPTLLAVPKFALAGLMGRELTEEVILAGQRVLPTVALSTGYRFDHPDLGSALRPILGK